MYNFCQSLSGAVTHFKHILRRAVVDCVLISKPPSRSSNPGITCHCQMIHVTFWISVGFNPSVVGPWYNQCWDWTAAWNVSSHTVQLTYWKHHILLCHGRYTSWSVAGWGVSSCPNWQCSWSRGPLVSGFKPWPGYLWRIFHLSLHL